MAGAPYLRSGLLAIASGLACLLAYQVTRRYLVRVIYALVRKTSFRWDDQLAEQNALKNLAHVVPALLLKMLIPVLFREPDTLYHLADKLANCYLTIAVMVVLTSLIKVIESVLVRTELFIEKPISSYFQILRIVIYIFTGILVLSEIMGKSPVYLLSAFGAMTAILLLIFKDTIMGLVASVQISANGMVKVGDWVEMPKFNADGDVIAINLYTVKIRNWDKTITTVPTYFFITDSFKNWRGMQESGGRRIKRSLYIDLHSVRFVTPEVRESYKRYQLISGYLRQRQSEIEQYNAEHGIDTSALINGRRMTNIGIFRNYALAYLRNHPFVNQDMAVMVRQLAMEDRGLPIEVYCFTNTTKWIEYEDIQANIFDHLLAAAAFFDLKIFQQPSGNDLLRVAEKLESR